PKLSHSRRRDSLCKNNQHSPLGRGVAQIPCQRPRDLMWERRPSRPGEARAEIRPIGGRFATLVTLTSEQPTPFQLVLGDYARAKLCQSNSSNQYSDAH